MPVSYKLGIFSGGIRTSGLEVLPKGTLMVLPMPSKGALKVLPKIAIGNFSGVRNRRGALGVLPNANEF